MRTLNRIVLVLLLLVTTGCFTASADLEIEDAPPSDTPPDNVSFNPVDITPDALKLAPRSIQIVGDYAYIASDEVGIFIYDITDPTDPEFLKMVDCSGSQEIVVQDGYAYLACGYEGLKIVDIDPVASAEVVGNVEFEFPSSHLVVSGGYAYITCGNTERASTLRKIDSVEVVDISDPVNPVKVASAETDYGAAIGIEISGDRLYLAKADNDDFFVFDISEPEAIEVLESYDLVGSAGDIAIKDDFVFVLGDGDTEIFDLNNLKDGPVGSLTMPHLRVQDIFIQGDYAYVVYTDPGQGLMVLDVSDPALAFEVARFEYPAYRESELIVRGNYAYLIDEYMGFRIIDISDPGQMNFTAHVPAIDSCRDFVVNGNYVYTVNKGALGIIDVSDPQSASIVKLLDLNQIHYFHSTGDLAVADGYAYVLSVGFKVIDIDPPESAHVIAEVDTAARLPRSIYTFNGYAYLNGEFGSIEIYKLDPPDNFSYVKHVATPGRVEGIFFKDNYAFVRCFLLNPWQPSMVLLDIDEPENAEIVKIVGVPWYMRGLDESGKFAYSTDKTDQQVWTSVLTGPFVYENFLRIVDIDPDSETSIWNFQSDILESNDCVVAKFKLDPEPGAEIFDFYSLNIAFSGGYAYIPGTSLPEGTMILGIFDVNPPQTLRFVGTYTIPVPLFDTIVSGEYAYNKTINSISILRLW